MYQFKMCLFLSLHTCRVESHEHGRATAIITFSINYWPDAILKNEVKRHFSANFNLFFYHNSISLIVRLESKISTTSFERAFGRWLSVSDQCSDRSVTRSRCCSVSHFQSKLFLHNFLIQWNDVLIVFHFALFCFEKLSLNTLGISANDVTKVLAAILLLGNLQYMPQVIQAHPNASASVPLSETRSTSVACNGMLSSEATSIADLLGISLATLFRALCISTHQTGGQLLQVYASPKAVNTNTIFTNDVYQYYNWSFSLSIFFPFQIKFLQTKEMLCRALYSRTLATIVRRINSIKLNSSHRSLNLTNGITASTNHAIYLLDMFGFQDNRTNRLEELCINLSAETLQHLFNAHTFKSTVETAKEDGLGQLFAHISYTDNVPCIDFLSSMVRPFIDLVSLSIGWF